MDMETATDSSTSNSSKLAGRIAMCWWLLLFADASCGIDDHGMVFGAC
jgi:hypothetical protein